MNYVPYNNNLKLLSRKLRTTSTIGEILLWKQLKAKSMMGYQFNRQKPLGNFIVDFYYKKLNLVIEIDGKYHGSEEQYLDDMNRQKVLEELHLNFLRFMEMDVRKDMLGVLRVIENYINEVTPPP